MGFLKNIQLKAGSTGIRVPIGNTADRPTTALEGQIRYNTDTSRVEYYQGAAWKDIASRGGVAITKDTFTGDGSTVNFTMSVTPTGQNGPHVYVGNVHQNPGVAYTISTSTLSFGTAPGPGSAIEVLHGYDSTDR